MRIADAQAIFAAHGFSPSRTESVATELRKEGLVPKGGRGPYAPHATSAEIAMFSIAVAASDRTSDAVTTAQSMAILVDHQGLPFLGLLQGAIEVPSNSAFIARVIFFPKMLSAEFEFLTEDKIRHQYFTRERWQDPTFDPLAEGKMFMGRTGFIGGGILHKLALAYARDLGATRNEAAA